jgi:hypothetical protein
MKSPMKTASHRRTPASNNRAHGDIDDWLKCKLRSPEFRAAYEAEDERIELVVQIIKRPKKKTRAEVLAAIKASKMRPMMTWQELHEMTREP